MKQLSNLPPGCTDYDIEEQAGAFGPDICDDDYKISDARNGYYVSPLDQSFSDYDDAIQAIVDDMKGSQFFPNVWYVNDHGNVDLLAINTETMKTGIVKSWV